MQEQGPVTGLCHSVKHTEGDRDTVAKLAGAFEKSPVPLSLRLQHFARHTRRQDLARLLARYELFKLVSNVHGSVVECGVYLGSGVLGWQHFSAILEPYNHSRRIIGFDTFAGFPHVAEEDLAGGTSEHLHTGALGVDHSIKDEIGRLAAVHDANRPLGHIPKVELVEGDACVSIPQYVEANPHLVISLLYLDFDLYSPTATALEHLLPRVVRGGIIAFDELNCQEFPGETVAAVQQVGLGSMELRRFPMDPYISYFVR